MRVALFTESAMRRDRDGAVEAIRDLYPRFIGRVARHVGHLTIVARCESVAELGEGARLEVSDDLSFRGLPFYRDTEEFYRRMHRLLPEALPAVFRTVREHDVVLLRIHNCLAFWVALAARFHGRPLAVYWAGPAVTQAARRNYPGSSLRHRAARLVASVEHRLHRVIARHASVNFFVDEEQHSLMRGPENTRWVVPTLVSEREIQGDVIRRTGEPLRIVFAGRLMPHKGVFDLLEAVRRIVGRHELRLDVAGRGPAASDLEEKVANLGLGQVVRLHGHMEWEGLQELLRRSHVFALPSHAEGLPKVMWEAWAAGTALVISPVGSVPRYVEDGVDGLLVPPGEPAELAEALSRLADDDGLRCQLARRGLQTAREYNWEAEAARIGDALRGLIDDDTRPRIGASEAEGSDGRVSVP